MVRYLETLVLVLLVSCGIDVLLCALPFAQERVSPSVGDLGGTFRFKGETASPFLAVGCLDHRTLMFIVREIEGSDPNIAKMLAERDCRPLLKDAEYVQCGGTGYAHPRIGEPLTYSAYCRKGAKDLLLYTLDIQMSRVK